MSLRVLQFVIDESEEQCIQLVSKRKFSETVHVDKKATFSASVNGERVELILLGSDSEE